MLHIFTLNWNGLRHLQNLAPSLLSNFRSIDYTWHIKDNNSSDQSIDYLKSINSPNINIINYHNNTQNFSEGNNYIYDLVSPKDNDQILLLNNDVKFNDSASIKNMLNLLKRDNVGVVGARLLYLNTNTIQHAGVTFRSHRKYPCNYRCGEQSDQVSQKNREFQAVTAACCVTTGEVYRNAGKLDTKFVWAFDDVDFCLTVKYNLNKRILYCGETNIFHEESASLKVNTINKIFSNQNLNYFSEKWLDKVDDDDFKYSKDSKYLLLK